MAEGLHMLTTRHPLISRIIFRLSLRVSGSEVGKPWLSTADSMYVVHVPSEEVPGICRVTG